ncbi:VOC family protein [uncultured Shimia sp.]|uniref:VOC family protein n=1 Tax=uncultured Shimia sp. TaxID=573152 RepID=UPI0025FC1025|nr:VOC family protein [uncultured Shimia sp.]
MTFIPYVYFDGTSEDAMDFYAAVFDADDVVKMRFSEAPQEIGMPHSDKIMYSHIEKDGWKLMSNDTAPGMPYQPQASVSVAHQTKTVEDARTRFDRLCEGGVAIMPFEKQFFSAGFGMCKDKYGTHWMIMVDDAAT